MTRLFSRIVRTGLVSLGLIVLANSAMAATDGTLGLTSIGTTDVSIIKGDTAQITGLTDIILVPWTVGDPAPIGTTNACVYTSTGAYQMTATSSSGSGTTFRMTDGAIFIDYVARAELMARMMPKHDITGMEPLRAQISVRKRSGLLVSC